MIQTRDQIRHELDRRTGCGTKARLLWCQTDSRVTVVVTDTRNGDAFELLLRDGERTIDVFHHSYLYAGPRELSLVPTAASHSSKPRHALKGEAAMQHHTSSQPSPAQYPTPTARRSS
jgi:hypothetical protein